MTMIEIAQQSKNEHTVISIVTATYNAESCLENLLKSIIAQKTEVAELIIIDGGSKDHTLEIIRRYERHIS